MQTLPTMIKPEVYTSSETDRVVGAKRLGQREEDREEIMYCRNQTGGWKRHRQLDWNVVSLIIY